MHPVLQIMIFWEPRQCSTERSSLPIPTQNGSGAGSPFELSRDSSLALRSGLNRLADYDSPGLETNLEVQGTGD